MMAKKMVKSNFRVVVYPDNGGSRWRKDKEERACKDIQAQIIRHVDGISHRNPQVFVESDGEYVCEFCERAWETDDDGYPLCCTKAAEEWEATQQPQPA